MTSPLCLVLETATSLGHADALLEGGADSYSDLTVSAILCKFPLIRSGGLGTALVVVMVLSSNEDRCAIHEIFKIGLDILTEKESRSYLDDDG